MITVNGPGDVAINFPDGTDATTIDGVMRQHFGGKPSLGAADTAIDVAKSAGTGLGEGLIGLAGLPGDLSELGARGLDYATRGVGKLIGQDFAPRPAQDAFGGAGQIQKAIEGVTGEFYKPKSGLGSAANTAGNFLPAIIGGPETLATKLATRVAAPALASEAAGAVTNDNPYAKAGGALVGAVAGPAAFNKAIKAMSPAAAEASLSDLKTAGRAGYQSQEVTDVRINSRAASDLAAKIETDLHGAGFRPTSEAKVFNAVDELRAAENGGRAATVADIDGVRKVLGNAAKEKDLQGMLTPQAVAAKTAMQHINDFLPNLKQADLLAGNAGKANAILDEARQNWGAYKRAQGVQTTLDNAKINAASANSGGNLQNSIKQAFKPMLKNNASKAVGYNQEELAALNQVVRGTWGGSAARAAGNLLGGGGGLGMLAGGFAGYEAGGVPGAITAGLAGRTLKKIGDKTTLNAVANLDRLLRSRAPEAIKIAAQNPQITQLLPAAGLKRLQTLIAADPVLSQQVAQPAN